MSGAAAKPPPKGVTILFNLEQLLCFNQEPITRSV